MENIDFGEKGVSQLSSALLHSIVFGILVVLFRISLDISYVLFVSDIFYVQGYALNYDLVVYACSWLALMFMMFITPSRLRKVSDYFFAMATLSVITPLTSFYGLSGFSPFPLMASMASLLGVFMIANLRLLKIPKLPLIRGGMTVGLIFSVAMALYLVSWYIESGAVRNMNFDLSKVYDYRELTSDITNIGVLAYLNSWTYNVFCLFIISYALLKRKYVLLLMAILAQIFYFSVSGHKSILFYPFIIFGIYYYFSKASSLLIMPLVFIAVVVTSLLAYYYFGHIFSASLFIRRLFFVPALLTYHYFDFFSYQPHVYWSNSFLSSFLSYPYATSIPKVIGEFNGSGSSANNGYISSGYAHAGLWGVFAYTIILGIILRFVDVVSRRCEALWFALVMTVVPLRNLLISSDLFTVMLTHGLIIAIVLLLLVRGQKNA